MNKPLKYLAFAILGGIAGATGYGMFIQGYSSGDMSAADTEREPLYWVAPMDPSYKRDKPGKSPMGMDLIPVYEEDNGGAKDSPGTVQISPDVVNNLGVRTSAVESDTFDTEIETVGYVQYDEDRLVHVHPRVEGWIEKLYVKSVGDTVKKGTPLYQIYSPTLVNAQEELLLALKQNNQSLVQAARKRLEALQVPNDSIEQLQRTGRIGQTITMYAPQSGVIDKLNIRDGFFVSPGTTMMSIGILDEVWVVGEIFERQVALVNVGDKVTMGLDYVPGRQWLGEVDYIYPELDTNTRTARIRMRFANSDHLLKPGMFAQLRIDPVKAHEKALLIPREALIRTGSQNRVVLALGDGKFKSIEVGVGRIGERKVEILTGLSAGDRIVTSAQFLIDSESSKTSDFTRMDHGDHKKSVPETVSVKAKVENLMPSHHMITLAHEAIEDWQWPAMTMDFMVDESVDLSSLKTGMQVHAEISGRPDGDYRITGIHIPDTASGSHDDPQIDGDEMDHTQHDDMNSAADSNSR